MARPAPIDEEIDRRALAGLRDRFLRVQRARLRRVRVELTDPQVELLDLLPLLFHVNHPRFPGFAGTDAPAGVSGYQPDAAVLAVARVLSRSFRYQRRAERGAAVHGLYLMGSLGSLGHSSRSDVDVWLCHDPRLSPEGLDALQTKAHGVEAFGRELGLEVHIFLTDVDAFRRGGRASISEDSSGTAQRLLLLDEFYRSGIHLAGRMPLWWLVPPGRSAEYAAYAGHLVSRRFVDPDQWLDFGGLDRLPAHELFGAAHWQLFKGIDAPYKALLKILLMEAYAAAFPDPAWLCEGLKSEIYLGREDDIDALDPYVSLYRRLEQYLQGAGGQQRLDLCRRALYFKAELPLSAYRGVGWRSELLRRLVAGWGWDADTLEGLDQRRRWRIEQVREERDLLVAELGRSYRLLTAFAQRHAAAGGIDALELNLLGRKLYSALERRPGKIDRVALGGAGSLAEARLRLVACTPSRCWRLEREPDGRTVSQDALKTADCVLEALAWAHFNGVMTRGSQLSRESGATPPDRAGLRRVRDALARHFPGGRRPASTLRDLAEAPRARVAFGLVNVGDDPLESLARSGLQVTTSRSDPLCFGEARLCLVRSFEYLVATTWDEILTRRFAGSEGLLDALCEHLQLTLGASAAGLPCHGIGGARAGLIARRVERLAADLQACFAAHGAGARYVVAIGAGFCIVQQDAGRFRWLQAPDREGLLDLLAEPQASFRPTVIDADALNDTPLHAVFERARPGVSQLYCAPGRDRIDLYLLDDRGALFHQGVTGSDEQHLLVQQRRFLDSLAARRAIGSPSDAHRWLQGPAEFYRVVRQGKGWDLYPVMVPEPSASYLDLVLVTDTGRGGFTLACGGRQFDSVRLGEALYDQVVDAVLAHRRGRQTYPIYLTGIASAALAGPGDVDPWGLLNLKKRIEARLNAVLQRRVEASAAAPAPR
jgi:adenylate cyclase class 1